MMRTLEEYLRANLEPRVWKQGGEPFLKPDGETVEAPVTEHRISVQSWGDGRVKVIVHPLSVDGDTLDFIVQGNDLHVL